MSQGEYEACALSHDCLDVFSTFQVIVDQVTKSFEPGHAFITIKSRLRDSEHTHCFVNNNAYSKHTV